MSTTASVIQQAISLLDQAAAQATDEGTRLADLTSQVVDTNSRIGSLEAQVADLTQKLQAAQQAKTGTPVFPGRYYALAERNWDPTTMGGNRDAFKAIAAAVPRLRTFTPNPGDTITPWHQAVPGNVTLMYIDMYAIYVSSGTADQHPDWVLKDAAGNRLYVAFTNDQGIAEQYAADITNPEFCSSWLSYVKESIARGGYKGLFIDDVNLALAVGDVHANPVTPIDRSTGKPMTLAAWQKYVVAFLTSVRNGLPGVEITHNQVWYSGRPNQNTQILNAINQCDVVYAERGFGQLDGGQGSNSIDAFLQYVDSVHKVGKPLAFGDYFLKDLNFSLACYFLAREGNDYFGIVEQAPSAAAPYWPKDYSVDIGKATGWRQWDQDGFWVRPYEHGGTVINEPGQPTKKRAFPQGATDPAGNPIPASLDMPGGSGIVWSVK